MAEQNNPVDSRSAGHELSDLSPKNIARFGAALALVIGATLLASYALFQLFYAGLMGARPLPSPLSYSREPTPEPRLSVNPGKELAALRAEENKLLDSYEWVDRDKGIVRIPIDRAVEILAKRGLAVQSEKNDRAPAVKPPPLRKEAKKR